MERNITTDYARIPLDNKVKSSIGVSDRMLRPLLAILNTYVLSKLIFVEKKSIMLHCNYYWKLYTQHLYNFVHYPLKHFITMVKQKGNARLISLVANLCTTFYCTYLTLQKGAIQRFSNLVRRIFDKY